MYKSTLFFKIGVVNPLDLPSLQPPRYINELSMVMETY